MHAYVEMRSQHAKQGRGGFRGPDAYVDEAVTLAEDWLSRPDTHPFEASADFSDCCRWCGENESAHQAE